MRIRWNWDELRMCNFQTSPFVITYLLVVFQWGKPLYEPTNQSNSQSASRPGTLEIPCHQAAGESENGGKRQVHGSWIQLDNWRKKVMLALNFKSISGWCRMSTYVMYKVQTEHGVILATGEVGSPSLSLRVENRTSILSFFQEEVFGWVLGGLGVVLGGLAGGCNNVLWPPVWITMSWYVETSSS